MARNHKDIKIVEFIQKMGVYSIGETAGFVDDIAERIVAEGYAKIISHKKPKMAPKVEEEEKDKDEPENKENKQMMPSKMGRPKKEYVTK